MTYEFDSEIKLLEGKIKWCVMYFPYEAEELFGSKGNIPVCITVDGQAFDHTLLPLKTGIISSITHSSSRLWARSLETGFISPWRKI